MISQEQYDEIKLEFPNGPHDKEEHAKFHLALFKFDNELVHMYGGRLLSVVYPAKHELPAEVYVFEVSSEEPYTFIDSNKN